MPKTASVKPPEAETPMTGEEPTLSASRTNAMGQKLLEFGFGKKAQFQLATVVFERPVKALTNLTEPEVLAVFENARRST